LQASFADFNEVLPKGLDPILALGHSKEDVVVYLYETFSCNTWFHAEMRFGVH